MKIEATLGIDRAEYLGGYVLELHFSNGHVNIVDFEKFLIQARNPMITKYRDKAKFRKFEIEDGDLMWNDFEMSFGLEDLYSRKVM